MLALGILGLSGRSEGTHRLLSVIFPRYSDAQEELGSAQSNRLFCWLLSAALAVEYIQCSLRGKGSTLIGNATSGGSRPCSRKGAR
jgi:hypothetical protein